MNFAKFLRIPFPIEHLRWLLLSRYIGKKTDRSRIKSFIFFSGVKECLVISFQYFSCFQKVDCFEKYSTILYNSKYRRYFDIIEIYKICESNGYLCKSTFLDVKIYCFVWSGSIV